MVIVYKELICCMAILKTVCYITGKDTVLSRMCYKGPTKLINDYKCTGLQYNYAIQKCYICSGNLCNGSNSMFANRNFVYGIFLVFCTLLCQFL